MFGVLVLILWATVCRIQLSFPLSLQSLKAVPVNKGRYGDSSLKCGSILELFKSSYVKIVIIWKFDIFSTQCEGFIIILKLHFL